MRLDDRKDQYDFMPAYTFTTGKPIPRRLRRKIYRELAGGHNKFHRGKRHKQRGRAKTREEKYQEYITSPRWYDFRASIIAARGCACEQCGVSKGSIHLHHLTYKNFGHERPEDVKLLCRSCHQLQHPKRKLG